MGPVTKPASRARSGRGWRETEQTRPATRATHNSCGSAANSRAGSFCEVRKCLRSAAQNNRAIARNAAGEEASRLDSHSLRPGAAAAVARGERYGFSESSMPGSCRCGASLKTDSARERRRCRPGRWIVAHRRGGSQHRQSGSEGRIAQRSSAIRLRQKRFSIVLTFAAPARVGKYSPSWKSSRSAGSPKNGLILTRLP